MADQVERSAVPLRDLTRDRQAESAATTVAARSVTTTRRAACDTVDVRLDDAYAVVVIEGDSEAG